MSRSRERAEFTTEQRVRLLEADADEIETMLRVFESRLAKIQAVLVGILISVTTASIMLAINLVAAGGGK